ncbi:hypothetical protein HDV02_001150 [Globomyces sp. JEL0801]|nr:hypothetical protein HDV02_001150 [Globomyces sp. JEL0801]
MKLPALVLLSLEAIERIEQSISDINLKLTDNNDVNRNQLEGQIKDLQEEKNQHLKAIEDELQHFPSLSHGLPPALLPPSRPLPPSVPSPQHTPQFDSFIG